MHMEKSTLLKNTINDILKRDIPSKEEISLMSKKQKLDLEKQQQQIIELFRERIAQQLNFYQDKMNFMMNEIMKLDNLELNSNYELNSINNRKALSQISSGTNEASDPQLKERITEIKTELNKLHALSTYKRRKAWR